MQIVPSIAEVNEAEAAYLGPAGQPVLSASLRLLRQRWEAGCRDRETALRLLFLCWYANIEPPFLTGIADIPRYDELASEAFETLGGAATIDPETCLIVALMTEIAPWCLGEPEHWERVGHKLRRRSRSMRVPEHLFAGRGAYGEYFSSMLASQARS